MTKRHFQFYVTRKRGEQSTKGRIISAFIAILFFIILGLMICCFAICKKKENQFLPKNFYFVYTSKYKKKSMLDNEKELLKKLGGANVVHFHKNEYYLLVNVYLNKDEAEEVVSNIKPTFANAGVVRISTSVFSKASRNQILSNFKLKNTLKRISSNFDEVLSYEMGYLAGKISESDVISKFVMHRVEFSKLKEQLLASEGILETATANYLKIFLLHYDNFFDKFYSQTNNREYLICKLATELIISQIELINNLAK